ncbi:hypothetical protein [Parasphingorhabdus sp.]|uniref:hypothetical protein n=1 Tax=Parasphingorhabdus sp. TaxID=2709688 RepID=UPI003593E80B
MSETAISVVKELMGSVDLQSVPVTLHSTLEKHQEHLLSLAVSLIDSGVPDEVAKQVVSDVLDSFKIELFHTIRSLREASDAL